MNTFKSKTGPFEEQPFYAPEEIERICTGELQDAGLFPATPAPVRIERFIEKRFSVTPAYEDLPDGVLGWTKFGPAGVEAVVVSRSLGTGAGVVTDRRISSTLAHEAGHGLLHAHLFVLGLGNASLFPTGADVEPSRILCRDAQPTVGGAVRNYGGRWWEVQANMAMAALLLPRRLVETCLTPLLTMGSFGRGALEVHRREEATRLVADTFDVNPVMARLRLGTLFPGTDGTQLTL
jgi:hypothetical protein